MAVLGHAYALAGQEAQARQILEQLKEFSRQRYVSGYYFALLHIGLGEKAQALDWLEKAGAEHSPLIVYLGVNPLFDSLRAEPRFRKLLRETGLGE